jgi:hypothetical protein
VDVVDVVLGAIEGVDIEGVDRGAILFNAVPDVNGTPLTTRGGVVLGVILLGVFEYEEPVPRLWEMGILLAEGPGEVARFRSLEENNMSPSLDMGAVCAR